MAEDPSPPPAEAPRPPSGEYFSWEEAEKARRLIEEGSTWQQDFGHPQESSFPKVHYKFNKFTQHTGPTGIQGGVQASPPVVQSPNAECRQLGHKWKHNGLVDSGRVEEWLCVRCNMTRHSTVSWHQQMVQANQTITKEEAAKILGKLAPVIPKPEVGWICFYCGEEFEDEEGLLDHEDLCAEA